MSNCTNNFIKRVIGVTRTFNWTITTNGAAVPLVAEDLTLQLVPPRGEAVSLPFDVDDNVVSFTWQGDDQHIIGCYSLILWANYGEDNQRRVDIHNFVELIPWSDRQSGEYSDLVEETIELETADFGENIMVVDNLNSTSATDALSANMGRQLNVTKQDVIQDLAAIRSGAAAGAAVKEWAKNDPLITDDGTQVSASKLAFNGNLFEQWVPGIASSIGLKGIAGFLKLADISQWDSAYNDRMLPTVAAVKAKLQAVLTALATIEAVIPSQASSTNKLTDKDYVDGAIATNTANFVGTFDTLAELQAVPNPTKNDYGFVIESDAQGNEYYDRYKYTGTQWLFEYKVESTPFTAEQWAAIQSGITAALVTKLSALPTNAELTTALASKQPVINDLTTIRSGAAAGATAYQKPLSGIPASDMASAVQISLGKADAALSRSDMATINGSDITHGGNVTIVAAEGQTITIDAAPTEGSNNAVSSGAVAELEMYLGKSFDITSQITLAKGYLERDGKLTLYNTWYWGLVQLKKGQRITVVNTNIGTYPSLGITDNPNFTIGDTATIVSGKTYLATINTYVVISAGTGLVSATLSMDDQYLKTDAEPTEDSIRPIQSGGVYKALYGEEDTTESFVLPITAGTAVLLDASKNEVNLRGGRIYKVIVDGSLTNGSNITLYTRTSISDDTAVQTKFAETKSAIDSVTPTTSFAVMSSRMTFYLKPAVDCGMINFYAAGANVLDTSVLTFTFDYESEDKGVVGDIQDLQTQINGVRDWRTIAPESLYDDKYTNTSFSTISQNYSGDLSGCKTGKITNVAGRRFKIFGKGTTDAVSLVAFADINLNKIIAYKGDYSANGLDVTAPDNAYYLAFNYYTYADGNHIEEYVVVQDGVETKIDAIENELTPAALPLKGKKIMFFGDSIGQFTQNGKAIADWFATYSGATCYNASCGGTRLVPRATQVETPTSSTQAYAALDISNVISAWCSGNTTYQENAANWLWNNGVTYPDYRPCVDAIKNNAIADVDIVVIGGGTNDINGGVAIGTSEDTTPATILGSLAYIVTQILTAKPSIKIYFYSPVVSKNGANNEWCDTYQFANGKTKPEIIALMAERVKAYHEPYIDLYWPMGWNQVNFTTFFPSDVTHPYNGFKALAHRIYSQILTML